MLIVNSTSKMSGPKDSIVISPKKYKDSVTEGAITQSLMDVHLIKTGGIKDELLCHGYVKQSFARKEITEIPPEHLITLIRYFYYQSTVHWIDQAPANVWEFEPQ